MIIEPKVRGFICTTAHPDGCAAEIERQIAHVRETGEIDEGPRRVLVIGSSMGYGLSTRIAAAWGAGAATLGICLEKEASGRRTATAGWYNTAAFHRAAREEGLWAETLNRDAFAPETKEEVVELLREKLGPLDLVVYSLAAPRRTLPDGSVAKSALKPIGDPYRSKTLDVSTGEVSEVEIEPADQREIEETVKVMGGEDWQLWIEALSDAELLADGAITLAYSYIGPELTYPLYREGTIGRAKDHLEATAGRLDDRLRPGGRRALVSVNKAVVTQSSSAIPVVPLYISLLFRVMKNRGLHEGCIEQMGRLFSDRLYHGGEIPLDAEARVRMDDLEMRADVQREVRSRWDRVTDENLEELADLEGYRRDFLRLFGFEVDEVDYGRDVDPHRSW